MNILISGDLSSLAGTIAEELSREKNKVVMASYGAEKIHFDDKEVKTHVIDSADNLFPQVLASYHFDAVIYLAPREEQLLLDENIEPGKLLDGLKNALELSRKEKAKRFFYISSNEVYGDAQKTAEDAEPSPNSLNGHTLYAGEQFCRMYQHAYGLNVHILRIPFVYGAQEPHTLLYALLKAGYDKQQVIFPAEKQFSCNFLHAEDIADFILRVLNEEYNPEDIFINLASSDQLTFAELQKMIAPHCPKTDFSFTIKQPLNTHPIEAQIARRHFDWIAERDLKSELPSIIRKIKEIPVKKPRPLAKIRSELTKKQGVLRWVELLVGGWLMHLLNNLTGTLIQFKYVDFRLLFVVLLGSVHGLRFGLLASVVASASIIYSWYQSGLDWALLVYNVENWLPIAIYIVAGAATGYQRDKKENQIAFQNKQFELMDEKYGVLYGVYADISRIKDQFREQLLGYRDSFGRIFNITQELDTYHNDDVFLKALGILENFLSNQSIAIYTLDQKNNYARLVVNSQSLNSKITKSMNITEYPQVVECISQHNIFQNIALLPNYPAYVAPISNDGLNSALVVIWEASFDQYSMYYYNLVKVISGLIQSSLVRAVLFYNANAETLYKSPTKILNPAPFREILNVKLMMRNNRLADFKLVQIEKSGQDWQDIDSRARNGIRSTDYIGFLEDGSCYILLSQANSSDISGIIDRLKKKGVKCKDVDESRVIYV